MTSEHQASSTFLNAVISSRQSLPIVSLVTNFVIFLDSLIFLLFQYRTIRKNGIGGRKLLRALICPKIRMEPQDSSTTGFWVPALLIPMICLATFITTVEFLVVAETERMWTGRRVVWLLTFQIFATLLQHIREVSSMPNHKSLGSFVLAIGLSDLFCLIGLALQVSGILTDKSGLYFSGSAIVPFTAGCAYGLLAWYHGKIYLTKTNERNVDGSYFMDHWSVFWHHTVRGCWCFVCFCVGLIEAGALLGIMNHVSMISMILTHVLPGLFSLSFIETLIFCWNVPHNYTGRSAALLSL